MSIHISTESKFLNVCEFAMGHIVIDYDLRNDFIRIDCDYSV